MELGKKKMNILFDTLDESGDGNVTCEEFASIAENKEMRTWLASMDIETDDLETLFTLIDDDGSGSVTAEELIARIPRIKGAARSIDVLAMRSRLNDVVTVMNKHSHELA